MSFGPRIERWRQTVVLEAKDIPTNIVLAIIRNESNGKPGAVGGRQTKAWEIPSRSGELIRFNRALGLMQIIPRTIDHYNQNHSNNPVYYEDMSGTDQQAVRLQVRVGCWVYARAVRVLYNYDKGAFPGYTPGVATPDQYLLALTIYAIGWGNLKPKLEALKARGVPLTFGNVAEAYPNWGMVNGQWVNRPLYYAQRVWRLANDQPDPIDQTDPQTELARAPWLAPVLLLGLTWLFKQYLRPSKEVNA